MNHAQLRELQDTLAVYFTGGCLVRWTGAGLLVAAVRPNTTLEEAKTTILNLIGNDLVSYNEIIYRLFLYQDQDEQFKTEATLYTKGSDYEGGMHTSYRQSTDADILIREIDFEFLSLAGRPQIQIEARNAGPSFQMRHNLKYGELFIMGMSYRGVTTQIHNNTWYLVF
jgi:hypothetical protein